MMSSVEYDCRPKAVAEGAEISELGAGSFGLFDSCARHSGFLLGHRLLLHLFEALAQDCLVCILRVLIEVRREVEGAQLGQQLPVLVEFV